jgi:hypothetical protein
VGDDLEKEGAALAVVGAGTGGFAQSSLDHTEYGFDLPALAVLLLVARLCELVEDRKVHNCDRTCPTSSGRAARVLLQP